MICSKLSGGSVYTKLLLLLLLPSFLDASKLVPANSVPVLPDARDVSGGRESPEKDIFLVRLRSIGDSLAVLSCSSSDIAEVSSEDMGGKINGRGRLFVSG